MLGGTDLFGGGSTYCLIVLKSYPKISQISLNVFIYIQTIAFLLLYVTLSVAVGWLVGCLLADG